MPNELINAVQAVSSLWEATLHRASRHKRTVYGLDAEDNERFYGQSQDFMFTAQYNAEDGIPASRIGPGGYYKGVRHKMSSNLVFNMVEAYMPALYARNPIRKVNPKRVEVPDDLLQWFEHYQQQEQMAAMGIQPGMGMPPMGMPPMGAPPMPGMAPPGMPPGMAGGMPPAGMPGMPPMPPPLPTHDIAMDAPQQRTPPPDEVKEQIRAKLVEWGLNQLTQLNDLKTESRAGLVDGLIHGRGCLGVEIHQMGDCRLPGSYHFSDDDLFVDPDVLHIRDAKWIAVRRRKPVYEVEREWGYPEGTLHGHFVSFQQDAQATVAHTDPYDKQKEGGTCDLIEYFEVYSRMGLGAHLKGGALEQVDMLEAFGQNCLLIVAPGHSYPLNLPQFLFEEGADALSPQELIDEVKARVEWPIPTWERPSGNPWPFAFLDLHHNPKESWPVAHTTPVLPIVKCINWVYSYMMGRIRIASRVFPVVPQELDPDVKDTILHGDDLELIEIKVMPGAMQQKLIEFITIPDVSKDLWTLLSAMIREFEKASGVSELMLTGQTDQQMRSAAEAQVKQSAMSARPEDMANTVQDWMTMAAENEAFALLHVMDLKDIAQLFGEPFVESMEPDPLTGQEAPPQMGKFTQLWAELLTGQNASDVMNYLEFDIESGSAQKKNQEQQLATAQQSMQQLFGPFYSYYQATGDPTQVNALVRLWAISTEHPNPDALMFPDRRQEIAMQQMQAQQQQAAQQAAQAQKAQGQQQKGQGGKPAPPAPMPPPMAVALAQQHFPIS